MTIKEALVLGDVQNRHENLWLLEKITGLTSTQLRLENEYFTLSPEAVRQYLDMLEQRRRHVPLQYILEDWDFMGLPMKCRPGVLIPRNDTEVLASEAIDFLHRLLDNEAHPRVLDLCTGSGCIGVALAYFCSSAYITMTDINPDALKLSQENATLNGVNDRITFVQANLFEGINDSFSCITANPPYIPTAEIASLPEEVKKEPILALDGGIDGLRFYRNIISESMKHLQPGGGIFLEIGNTQKEAVEELLYNHGFKNVKTIKDIENRDRVVRALI
ncbi:MAG: peptide chain release factor N(5)-glutamine methyltransferase [Defluviitaleaceae bacterium]|nr:peptide chain release factor N(5)-glutamine methyltransferase [Defluviitaleaceae bacterium]